MKFLPMAINMNRVYYLRTPISENDLKDIEIGDRVYITGTIVTARDAAHRRFLVERQPLPIDLKGLVLFHAGPVVNRSGDKWILVSIGPTTSSRMEPYEADFIEKTGVRVVIGKGFMGRRTAEACRKFKCIVTLFPGGCAALASEMVKDVVDVYWLDLGIPEAIWILQVEAFGPLIVTIDSNGNNVYDERARDIQHRASIVRMR